MDFRILIDSASALQRGYSDSVLDLSRRASTVQVGFVLPGAYKRLIVNIHEPMRAVPDRVFREESGGVQRFSVVVTECAEGEPFVFKIRASIRRRVMFSKPRWLGASTEVVIVARHADVDAQFAYAGG